MGDSQTEARLIRDKVAPVYASNLWQWVRFRLCEDLELVRRVVQGDTQDPGEISAQSAIGRALVFGRPGERIEVEAPGGQVLVEVLEISDAALPRNHGDA